MNSKERVMETFSFHEADRVPLWCGASPEFMAKAQIALGLVDDESVFRRFGDDFRRVFPRYAGPVEHSPLYKLPEGATFRSPFGIARHGYGYGQPMEHPLQYATLSEVHDYPWPDPAWMSADRIKQDAAKWQGEYAILGGDWSPFWHDAIDLMGMEALMVAMYEAPETVEAMMAHLTDYYAGVNEIIFEEAGKEIDIMFIGNDLGAQNGPLVGGHLFQRFVQPYIKRLADIGHRYGKKVMLHCCGSIQALIPFLIEAGVDALQALQPDAIDMDPRGLKQKYGNVMVFNGCIDSHYVLIKGTPQLAWEKTRETLEIMMPGGGYVLSPSHDYLLEETPVETVLAMYDAAREFGRY